MTPPFLDFCPSRWMTHLIFLPFIGTNEYKCLPCFIPTCWCLQLIGRSPDYLHPRWRKLPWSVYLHSESDFRVAERVWIFCNLRYQALAHVRRGKCCDGPPRSRWDPGHKDYKKQLSIVLVQLAFGCTTYSCIYVRDSKAVGIARLLQLWSSSLRRFVKSFSLWSWIIWTLRCVAVCK